MCDVAQYVDVVKNIVLACTGVFAGYVAWQGLTTWRRQLYGNAEYDLVKRLLLASYRLREEFKKVRHPAMWGSEMPSPPKEMNLNADQTHFYGMQQAYMKRWEGIDSISADLNSSLLEAEVLWGASVRGSFDELIKLRHELLRAISLHLQSSNPSESQEGRRAAGQLSRKGRDIMYDLSTNEEPDQYTKDVQNAIAEIENAMKPHISEYFRRRT